MTISEVTIDPVFNPSRGLLAFAHFTIDDAFAVKDAKIVTTPDGRLLVAMPSHPKADACLACGSRTPLTSLYCGKCGVKLEDGRVPEGAVRSSLYREACYPISAPARALIERAILDAYRRETGAKVDAATDPDAPPLGRRVAALATV